HKPPIAPAPHRSCSYQVRIWRAEAQSLYIVWRLLCIYCSSVGQAGDHRIDNQYQQHDTQAEEEISERTSDTSPAQPLVAHAKVIQTPFGNQPVIPAAAFMKHFVFRYPPGENNRVHRELLNPKMGIEKMDRKDKAGGQQRLIRMNNQCDVDYPARQESRKKRWKPHHQS